MHSQLSWRWTCRKINLAFREVVAPQGHVHVKGLLSWKGHMIVKLAIMALGIINTTTRRITRRFMNNNNSNGLNIIIIINRPQLKSNRLLLLEKNIDYGEYWNPIPCCLSYNPPLSEYSCIINYKWNPIIIIILTPNSPNLAQSQNALGMKKPIYTVNVKYSHLIKEVYPGSAAEPSPL